MELQAELSVLDRRRISQVVSCAVRLFGVVVLAGAISALHAQDRVIEKTYRVPGHAALQLNADDASINAFSCGGCATVQVKVDFHDADPTRYELKESQNGTLVHFELKR